MINSKYKSRETHRLTWLLVAVLMLVSTTVTAAIDVRLDRTSLTLGETVTLVLQTDDPQQSLETDFSVLSQDFEVLDQRSESQLSIINGQQMGVVRLLITLEPKRAGQLVVPGFSFTGGAASQPISVDVQPAPELAPGELPPVFVETQLNPDQGPYYVHGQLGLTVRVFYLQNLTEAGMNPPAPEQASVRLLDEVPYQAERNGQQYRVLERRYAIFPERSGELTIPPIVLTGRLVQRSNGLWQPGARGRRIRVQSDPVQVTIEPRAADYTGDVWIPARSFSMDEQLATDQGIRVGEPVTRTIILNAVGLEDHMLPDISLPEMDGMRVYPDQPQGITRDNGEWVLGHKEYRFAVVPEQEGVLVLPELKVDWWDTTNNQQRTTVLPQRTLTVLPSAVAESIQAAEPVPVAETTGDTQMQANTSAGYWPWITGLFAGLWLATLVFALRRKPAPEKQQATSHVSASEQSLLSDLKHACQQNNAQVARSALATWLRRYGPREFNGSLRRFAKGVQASGFTQALNSLDGFGYQSESDQDWTGAGFWGHFDSWLSEYRKVSKDRHNTIVTDLYAHPAS